MPTPNASTPATANGSDRLIAPFTRYLDRLIAHPVFLTVPLSDRLRRFKDHLSARGPTLRQVYALLGADLLGESAGFGYRKLTAPANFKFPEHVHPQLGFAYGWHYFACNLQGDDGAQYGLLFMLFRRAPFPNDLATELGLTPAENTLMDVQFAITDVARKSNIQAEPTIVAGTTEGLRYSSFPGPLFTEVTDIASLRGPEDGAVFPLRIATSGVTADGSPMAMDVTFGAPPYPTGAEYLLKGEAGCMPVISGIGTYYFSVPMMPVQPGSRLELPDGRVVGVTGIGWMDHQWGAGVAPYSPLLRAVGNAKVLQSGERTQIGWDFLVAQIPGVVSLSAQAFHAVNPATPLYDADPGTVTRDLTADLLLADGTQEKATGQVVIRHWQQAQAPTFADLFRAPRQPWWPVEWEVSFAPTAGLPEGLRYTMRSLTGAPQIMSFGDGTAYQEAAVELVQDSPSGPSVIGHGYGESFRYSGIDDQISALLTAGFSPEEVRDNLDVLAVGPRGLPAGTAAETVAVLGGLVVGGLCLAGLVLAGIRQLAK